MRGYCTVCGLLVPAWWGERTHLWRADPHYNRDGEACRGFGEPVRLHAFHQPLRGLVRPALELLGQAVTVVLSTIGQIRDSWGDLPVDDSCSCRRHRRPHRSSTPRSVR